MINITEVKEIIYPSQSVIGKHKNYEFIILWMLLNNEKCVWGDFLDKRINMSQSTLSNLLQKLIDNNYIIKEVGIQKGRKKKIYIITELGKKRYENLLLKKEEQKRSINYPSDKYLALKDEEINIFYILHNNPFCRWKDFQEGPFKINNTVLSRILKQFQRENFIEKVDVEDSRFDVYQITEKGTSEYISRLKSYKLDRQSILDEESKKIQEILSNSRELLKSLEIPNDNVKYRLLNNILTTDFSSIKGVSCSTDDYLKIIYFITLNHPEEYPNYITPENFSKRYGLDLSTLKFFLKEIVDRNQFDIKFFKLKITPDKTYYFQVGEEFEKILRAITTNIIKKLKFLNIEAGDDKIEDNPLNINKLNEEIIKKINIGYFHKSIADSIIKLMPNYLEYLKFLIEKKKEVKTPRDKLKSIAFRGISLDEKLPEEKLPKLKSSKQELSIKIPDEEISEEYLQIALDEMDNIIRLKPYKIENYYRKVDLLLELRNYENALYTIQKALILGKAFKEKENLDTTYEYKARILYELDRYEEAANTISKAIEINPNWNYYYKKADYLRLARKFDEALVVINTSIEKFPDEENSWQLKAMILKSKKQFKESLKAIDQAIKLGPNWWGHYSVKGDVLMEMGEYTKAITAINKAIDLRKDISSLYIDKANCLISLRKYKETIKALDKAMVLNPDDDWDAVMFKKDVYIKMKDFEGALKFVDSLEDDPNNKLLKAEILHDKGEYNKALDIVNNVIKVLFNDPFALDLKSKCLNKLGLFQESLDTYMKILEIDPYWILNTSDVDYLINLFSNLNKSEDFLQLIDELFKDAGEVREKVYLHFAKSEFFKKVKKYENSLEEINKLIELKPSLSSLYYEKADILRKMKKYKAALQEIKKGIMIDSNNHYIYYTEGKIHFDTNNYEKAIKSFKKGLDISYNYEKKYKYNIRIGDCYFKLGKFDEATSYLKKGKKLAEIQEDEKWIKKSNFIMKSLEFKSEDL